MQGAVCVTPYFEDLTSHQYVRAEPTVKNVGWLAIDQPFAEGETSESFRRSLAVLCERPLNLTRGWQACGFCGNAKGNGEIRVQGADGQVYAAPQMIHHYVTVHGYQPPEEFIAAVLSCESRGGARKRRTSR